MPVKSIRGEFLKSFPRFGRRKGPLSSKSYLLLAYFILFHSRYSKFAKYLLNLIEDMEDKTEMNNFFLNVYFMSLKCSRHFISSVSISSAGTKLGRYKFC